MATPINMPQVGQDIETAIVTEWKVKEGDILNVGDVVALVESDKAVFEVETFEAGILLKIVVKEGEEGKVFAPIAYVGPKGEEGEKNATSEGGGTEKGERKTEKGERTTFRVPPSTRRVFASPSARRLALQYDVDLGTLKGTGPNDRIIKSDILKAVESADIEQQIGEPESQSSKKYPVSRIPHPASNTTESNENNSDQIIPFTKIRQSIADRMTRSATTIPHFYLSIDVDMTAALAWRKAFNLTSEVKISVNDLIIRAVAQILARYPRMNAHAEVDKLIVKNEINIGVAVSVEDGLIVPVIPRADRKSLQEISLAAKDIAEQAKNGLMKPTNPGTFTISNLGMYGIDQFWPIINPPEAAILGVGTTTKKMHSGPGNSFAPRDILKLTLACDHRAINGAYGAEFLCSIKNVLEGYG